MGVDGLTPDEVFDTNHDYLDSEHEREHPRHPTLNAVGRVALLFASGEKSAQKIQEKFSATVTWFKNKLGEWNQKRLDEKAERKDYGTFNVVGDIAGQPSMDEPQYEPVAPAHPVGERTGVYHSNFSKEPPQPDPELSQGEMDEIMHGAITRARAKLGQLPVIYMSTHKPLQDLDAPLPSRQPSAHTGAFTHDYAGEVLPTDAALDRLAQAAQDGTLAAMGGLEPPRTGQPRGKPDKIATFSDALPSRRRAKEQGTTPKIPLGDRQSDEELLARLNNAFAQTSQPDDDDTASRQRPYLGHDKLPRHSKKDGDKLDSTNA
jgi:hypothetical protein